MERSLKKMVFSEYVKGLKRYKRLELIEEIMQRCLVSKPTVYRWMKGESRPLPMSKRIIAEILNVAENDLVI